MGTAADKVAALEAAGVRVARTPEEIACWFIDDDYNGESFFVRQAYFTGMDEPYQKLSRTLRAEIN